MKKIIIDGYETPIRIDRYLRNNFKELKQAIIEKFLRQKLITLAGKKIAASQRVQDGDEIEIAEFLLQKTATPQRHNIDAEKLANEIRANLVIYDHQDFMAINKPAGLAVQSGSKIKLSVDDALPYLGAEYRLVHRLDKKTSGILLIAKQREAAIKLTTAFADKVIDKEYEAIIQGQITPESGEVRCKIAKSQSKHFQKVILDPEHGRMAHTIYQLIAYEEGNSRVTMKPITGRMHQLRFHAAYIGHAIIGDSKYGNDQQGRLMLHAKYLRIPGQIFDHKKDIEIACRAEF